MFDKLKMYSRFIFGLREFLKEPITLEQSRQIIQERLQNRGANFLAVVRRAIYENPASPYLKLLKLAGCEYGDIERMVTADGVEPALKKLLEEGVYLSYEEFKRGKPVTRGHKSFEFAEKEFDNPLTNPHLEEKSSGSSGAGTRTTYEFDFIAYQQAVYMIYSLDAYNALEIPVVLWRPIMPGNGARKVLEYYKAGRPVAKWFSPVSDRDIKPSLKNRLATAYIVHAGRLFGAHFPEPEYVAVNEAWRVAAWIAQAKSREGGCYVDTYASSAVRICQAAREKGLDISGTKFRVTGEPLTEAKQQEIKAAGAAVYTRYSFSESGYVGFGCFNPVFTDEVHLFSDIKAVIQRRREVSHAGVTVDAFLFTTLLSSSPKIMLNVETGDYGVIMRRNCGCEFEKLGLTEHIHTVRGFDKLTGEGMTFIGTDFVRIIEGVLPAKFGGASTDYQMIEEEDEASHTRMSIIVSPAVGDIDEHELIRTVLAELGKGQDNQRMMADMWSKAGTFQVKRQRPYVSASGKLMPLRIQKKS